MKLISAASLCALAGAALAGPAEKAPPRPWNKGTIAITLLAGPKPLTAKAAVKTMDGKELRPGSNGWTCYPGPNASQAAGAMCVDAVWDQWMQAYMSKSDFHADRVGIAYMLAGDEGGSLTDPFATAPTKDNQWIVEGPHIMVLLPDPKALEGLPTDPKSGGPYVMWKGTPYAHIMVPVDRKR